MKFRCKHCGREVDLAAADILSIGGHPVCCDEDMGTLPGSRTVDEYLGGPPVSTDDGFEQFVDDSVYAVASLWIRRGGPTITLAGYDALEHAIKAFFSDMKRG